MSITLFCISFILIEIKFTHYYFGVMFLMKSTSIHNDQVNYDEILI